MSLDEDAVAVFRDGGPDHDLLRDLRTLVLPLFETKAIDREVLQRRRRILIANPRLIVAVHEFYEKLSAEVVGHIAVREGPAFAARRAQVAVKLLAALFDSALESFLGDTRNRTITFHFDECLRTARSLLGLTSPHHRTSPGDPPWPPTSTASARPPTGAGRSSSPAGWC